MQLLYDAVATACALQRVAYFTGRAFRGLGGSDRGHRLRGAESPSGSAGPGSAHPWDRQRPPGGEHRLPAIVESHCPVLLVPPGTGRDGGTVDKAISAWIEKVQCIDGHPPLEASHTSEAMPMTRPKSILVATDLNDLDFLLPVAIDQARMAGAMIWLLHVIPPEAYASIESGAYPLGGKDKEYRDAEAALVKAAAELRRMNLACAYEVRRWYPVDEIKDFIREHSVERLILGTSGRGKLGKLLIGSVAEQLIRSLDIPVCTVGPHFEAFAPNRPRRIVFAFSLRHHPEHSLGFAVDLAAASSAELIVLHVTEQDRGDEGLVAGAMSKIEELLRGIPSSQVRPQIRIRSGEPADEIVAECKVLRPESLILSASSTSPASARFRAGVVYRVISQAPCPTFTLPSGPKTKHGGNYREFSQVHGPFVGRRRSLVLRMRLVTVSRFQRVKHLYQL